MNIGTVLFFGLFSLFSLTARETYAFPGDDVIPRENEVHGKNIHDACDEIDCEEGHKCFLYNSTKKAVCVASRQQPIVIESENSHARFKIECPPKKQVGLKPGTDQIDCGIYRADDCEDDTGCSRNKICCHDGCWVECVDPILQRYPEP